MGIEAQDPLLCLPDLPGRPLAAQPAPFDQHIDQPTPPDINTFTMTWTSRQATHEKNDEIDQPNPSDINTLTMT